ncbi:hypothetical protein CC1G_14584 [Coprinopsis cinerea okayama7|uniref:Uncharacterized protein n=1 Tax=Coprinopsis cinerea (strain Okayama-7 / 130 / ATCC MYA-4618 / FGSC 9003) TaxID=240176 RepID=D6RMU8_COPC7|nr:hypothetical protein CC1G_14584 [Coprinopsis cinerea okayama7\|eukprot:XP_002911153.1 hypothetical protein CC1G_14584 [Coprinopsis cinerea okayama7\
MDEVGAQGLARVHARPGGHREAILSAPVALVLGPTLRAPVLGRGRTLLIVAAVVVPALAQSAEEGDQTEAPAEMTLETVVHGPLVQHKT